MLAQIKIERAKLMKPLIIFMIVFTLFLLLFDKASALSDKITELTTQLEITRKVSFKQFVNGYYLGCIESVRYLCYAKADCSTTSIEELQLYCTEKKDNI
jgi:fucose 4-O-acetylase-like acetyltransferase